ncbi:YihY/virulence factor BrkB family protein [Clostridium sp. SYSU_GA19001]|uniref:YihY/virulence factor BrkB family protein n=1 Tax=Clostridium caldaquaticum TaxID=2940653 RepID=UPI0020777689|nr:YihY/virulence factor BrkB family protein [Clostridium caldaquaticum]MCM8711484.1 YihY/virulence factor BrkB family protein [Clostridium caldaquaticum]
MVRYKKRSFIRSLIFRYIDDEITAMASQLAYSLLLSFFPFLILLMTLIGYSSIKSEDVIKALGTILPAEVLKLIKNTISEVVDTKRSDLLSFSMITTIWTASNGFNAVIRGLNRAYDEKEKRPYWKVQLTAMLCTIGLVLIIIITFALLVFGELGGRLLINKLKYTASLEFLMDFGRYTVGLIVMIIVFTVVYRYTPSKRLNWKETLPGAIFTTIGWTLLSLLFSFYVNNFGSYSKIYGSIGAVIALMSWLFISSIIILIGGEINATLAYRKLDLEKHKGKKY